jgi:hypothetical protein
MEEATVKMSVRTNKHVINCVVHKTGAFHFIPFLCKILSRGSQSIPRLTVYPQNHSDITIPSPGVNEGLWTGIPYYTAIRCTASSCGNKQWHWVGVRVYCCVCMCVLFLFEHAPLLWSNTTCFQCTCYKNICFNTGNAVTNLGSDCAGRCTPFTISISLQVT